MTALDSKTDENICQYKGSLILVAKGKMLNDQHICSWTTCQQKDHSKLEHPECPSIWQLLVPENKSDDIFYQNDIVKKSWDWLS